MKITKKQTWWLIIGAVVVWYLYFNNRTELIEIEPDNNGAGGGAEGIMPIRQVGKAKCRGMCKIRTGTFRRKIRVPCTDQSTTGQKDCVCQGTSYSC